MAAVDSRVGMASAKIATEMLTTPPIAVLANPTRRAATPSSTSVVIATAKPSSDPQSTHSARSWASWS